MTFGRGATAALLAALTVAITPSCGEDVEAVADGFEVTQQAGDWRGEIIYQIIVDRFANGDLANDYRVVPSDLARYQGGDFQGIIDNVDYLVDLGVTAVWISPVVRNVEHHRGFDGYHGYWTQDFLRVNPHFGDLAKLREMVNVLHEHDILVIVDVVTNHIGPLFYYDINHNGQPDDVVYGTGTQSPLTHIDEVEPDFDLRGVQAFTSLGEAGPAPIRWFNQPELNLIAPQPPEFQNPEWYNRRGRIDAWGRESYACAEAGIDWENDWDACYAYVRTQEETGDFPSGLRDLRTELPEVREALIDVMVHWIEVADIDGFRIDTIKHVELDFWDVFASEVRRRAAELGKRNFLMIGEAFDGQDWLVSQYVEPGRLDTAFHFRQNFEVIHDVFQRGGPTSRIPPVWAGRDSYYSDEGHPGGVISVDGGPLAQRDMLVNFIDNHDMPRFLYGAGSDAVGVGRLHNALAFILFEEGIPCVYYGTEQQFNGLDDPMNRLPLWWTGYDRQNPTFVHMAALTRLRQSMPELMYGSQVVRWSTDHVEDERDAGIFAFERERDGDRALVVQNVLSTQVSETAVEGRAMAVGFAPGTTLMDAMPGSTCTPVQVTADGCNTSERAPGCLTLEVPPLTTQLWVSRERAARCAR